MMSKSAGGRFIGTNRRWYILFLAAILIALAGWEANQRNWRSAATSLSFVALLGALESGWSEPTVGRWRRAVYVFLVLYVVTIALWRVLGIVQPSAG